jgi:hypothetical protein
MVGLMLAGPGLRQGVRRYSAHPRVLSTRLPSAALPSASLAAVSSPGPDRIRRQHQGVAPVGAVCLLLAVALWMAPEAPQDQAAICQRHNGVAACRVW